MRRIGKWALRILIGLFILILVTVIAFIGWDRIRCWDFYGQAEKGMSIPGLWDGYVSQGFTYLEEKNVYLTCGYHKSGEASRIYILDGEEQIRVDMKNTDGSDYTGHTGGIDVYGQYVYVTADDGLDLFFVEDVFDGDGVACVADSVSVCMNPAYCTIFNDTLFTGSFYDEGNYETPMEHRFETPAGDQNTAILAVYPLNIETGKPVSDIPEMIYSTRSQIQGMTFIDSNIVALSSSYGLAISGVHFYDMEKLSKRNEWLTVNGTDVPVYFLDSSNLIESVEAPPMAEELVYLDGKIWIMNESACTKYWFGKLTSGNHVYGIPLPDSVKQRIN